MPCMLDQVDDEEAQKSWRGVSVPEARLMAKNFQNSLWGSAGGKRLLMLSLKAKLNAWVGKYRITCTNPHVLMCRALRTTYLYRGLETFPSYALSDTAFRDRGAGASKLCHQRANALPTTCPRVSRPSGLPLGLQLS